MRCPLFGRPPRERTRQLRPASLHLLAAPCSLLVLAATAFPCTNFIVTPGASVDGSAVITYTCDGEFHPILRSVAAADHQPGEKFEIKDWSGKVLGGVTQTAHTYAVVNLMNEHQLTIAETTTDGRPELQNPEGLLAYWHLMQLTLERARTAREAVQVMGQLVATYGYRSTAESFAIGDPREAWIMEMIGPGPGGQGAYWVALRVPDGSVCAYANLGRIGSFPLHDAKNCLYSPGLIEFATARGYYDPASGRPFSWREAFHPATAQKLRYTATRVWSLFRRCDPSQDWSTDYNRGVPGAEPYPLWIKPDHKLSLPEVFALMRDHYEGTEFDMTQGVDAGPFGNPNRWRPMTWSADGVNCSWERPISTQQTGFSMICQCRASLPDPVGGVTWYGVDDTYTCCYVPLYCCIESLPRSYTTGSLQRFTWDSAWWTFNFVANLASLKYSAMIQDIRTVQADQEGELLALQPAVEKTAAALAASDPDLMKRYLTDYSVQHAEAVVSRWRQLGEELLTKYNDGYVKDQNGQPQEVGYPEAWLHDVLQLRPDRFRMPGQPADSLQAELPY